MSAKTLSLPFVFTYEELLDDSISTRVESNSDSSSEQAPCDFRTLNELALADVEDSVTADVSIVPELPTFPHVTSTSRAKLLWLRSGMSWATRVQARSNWKIARVVLVIIRWERIGERSLHRWKEMRTPQELQVMGRLISLGLVQEKDSAATYEKYLMAVADAYQPRELARCRRRHRLLQGPSLKPTSTAKRKRLLHTSNKLAGLL